LDFTYSFAPPANEKVTVYLLEGLMHVKPASFYLVGLRKGNRYSAG